MGNVSENSKEAFRKVNKDLTQRQSDVLRIFQEAINPLTAKMVSTLSGIKINAVTPRINELLYDLQLIKIVGTTKTGRKSNLYTLRSASEEKTFRELSNKEKLSNLVNAITNAEIISLTPSMDEKTPSQKAFEYLNRFINDNGLNINI